MEKRAVNELREGGAGPEPAGAAGAAGAAGGAVTIASR